MTIKAILILLGALGASFSFFIGYYLYAIKSDFRDIRDNFKNIFHLLRNYDTRLGKLETRASVLEVLNKIKTQSEVEEVTIGESHVGKQ
jgi:hypothetical protein